MDINQFQSQYQLVEGILKEVRVDDYLRSIAITIDVGEYNYRPVVQEKLAGLLTLRCTTFIEFKFTRNPELALTPHPLDQDPDAQVGRTTIIGFHLNRVSPSGRNPPPSEADTLPLYVLSIETMDSFLEVVFAALSVSFTAE